MRLYIAVITCLVAVNCWAQDTKSPLIVRILSVSEANHLPPIMLINDEPFVLQGVSSTRDHPEAKTLESVTGEFELRDTPKGQLIILGVKGVLNPQFAAKTFNNKGYCVTADYSSVPPSIKLTKEPEKYSYWKVPTEEKGPIINVSDFKKPAYLSLDSEITNFAQGQDNLEMRRVILSLDPTYQFKVMAVSPLQNLPPQVDPVN